MAGLAIGLLTLSLLRLKSNTGTRIASHGAAALCYSSARGQRAAILVHVCVSACRCVTVSVFMLCVSLRQSPEPCERRHSSLSSEALQTPTYPTQTRHILSCICCHQQNLSNSYGALFFFVCIFFLLVGLFLMLIHPFFVTPSSSSSLLSRSRDQNGPLVGFSASPFPLFNSLQPIRSQAKEEKGAGEQRDNTPLNYSSLCSFTLSLPSCSLTAQTF